MCARPKPSSTSWLREGFLWSRYPRSVAGRYVVEIESSIEVDQTPVTRTRLGRPLSRFVHLLTHSRCLTATLASSHCGGAWSAGRWPITVSKFGSGDVAQSRCPKRLRSRAINLRHPSFWGEKEGSVTWGSRSHRLGLAAYFAAVRCCLPSSCLSAAA